MLAFLRRPNDCAIIAGGSTNHGSERKVTMKQDNRVLGRQGARELTPQEAEQVTGAYRIRTFTACGGDAAIGEC
jgi:hypothetical protein